MSSEVEGAKLPENFSHYDNGCIIADPNSGTGYSVIAANVPLTYGNSHGGPGGSSGVVIEGDVQINGNITFSTGNGSATINVNQLMKERADAVAERDTAAAEADEWYALYKAEQKKNQDLQERFDDLVKDAVKLAEAVRGEEEQNAIRDKEALNQAQKGENLWNAIKGSTIPNDYKEYIKRNPQGIHVLEAMEEIKKLEGKDAENPHLSKKGHKWFA